jgi:hypothetical protein
LISCALMRKPLLPYDRESVYQWTPFTSPPYLESHSFKKVGINAPNPMAVHFIN